MIAKLLTSAAVTMISVILVGTTPLGPRLGLAALYLLVRFIP